MLKTKDLYLTHCLFSFIGVSSSLPMTAYIKMIDVWMIFTMMYPFCIVTLYSIMELIKDDDICISFMQGEQKNKRQRTIKAVNCVLDYGLPLMAFLFIVIFCVLGFINCH